ncbi:MAG: hypothetical protein A2W36_05865 [Chloroflexi bacterium RBG_16_58_14]|nr:MAG: hypothetical protein A2W36_05865 [Chloroflexi bacterium RBG_16_58_14]
MDLWIKSPFQMPGRIRSEFKFLMKWVGNQVQGYRELIDLSSKTKIENNGDQAAPSSSIFIGMNEDRSTYWMIIDSENLS